MSSCMHVLKKLRKLEPAATGKPWRYRCERCGQHFKIATGIVTKEA